MCKTCGCGQPGNSHGKGEMPAIGKSKPAPVKPVKSPMKKGGRKK